MNHVVVKNFDRVNEQVLEEVEKLDVSTIYEAQGKKGLLTHTMKPIQDNQFIVGHAVTVHCASGDNLMIHAAIEVCQPNDILIVTTEDDTVDGMIGELIVSALVKKGVRGLIIESGIRDVKEIREMPFPVWSKGNSSKGTTKNSAGSVNIPITLAGQIIEPGDIIVGDDDGVVVIKKEEVQSSIELSVKRLEKEVSVKEKIAKGQISLDFYDLRPVLENLNVQYVEHYDDYKKGRK